MLVELYACLYLMGHCLGEHLGIAYNVGGALCMFIQRIY
jgi:hypothetical protein